MLAFPSLRVVICIGGLGNMFRKFDVIVFHNFITYEPSCKTLLVSEGIPFLSGDPLCMIYLQSLYWEHHFFLKSGWLPLIIV